MTQELYERGFSLTDVAAMAGVRLPQLRSWRHGGADADEAAVVRLAKISTTCQLLDARGDGTDAAGWFETRLLPGVAVTPVDLATANRFDLVTDHANNTEPSTILDRFDPQWEQRYRSKWEVFVAADGVPSLRPAKPGD